MRFQAVIVIAVALGGCQFLVEGSELKTISRCFDQGVLPLRCSPGSIIRVFNITYARSQSNSCDYQESDCKRSEQTSFGCNGKMTCDLEIRKDTRHYAPLPGCDLHGNYIRVAYECVKQAEIANLCRDVRSDRLATKGYVSSPLLSGGNYSALLNCTYTIRGSDIRIHLITVNLTDTHDCIGIHYNGVGSKTYCGGRSIIENLDIPVWPTKEIKILFTSSSMGHFGGVWLYYEMIPEPIPVVRQTVPLLPSTQSSRRGPSTSTARVGQLVGDGESVPALRGSWTSLSANDGDNGDTDITIYNNVSAHLPPSTLATILGLIFGLFGTLILVLLTAYFIKRCRDNKRKRMRQRSDISGAEQIMWHNLTNESLSAILQKHDSTVEQAYSNNVMAKGDNFSSHEMQCYKPIQHSYC